jgi:hypothetical protein
MVKSRRMRWAGHVAHTRGGEVHRGIWWGNLRKRDHLENPRVDLGGRRIIKKKKWDGGMI